MKYKALKISNVYKNKKRMKRWFLNALHLHLKCCNHMYKINAQTMEKAALILIKRQKKMKSLKPKNIKMNTKINAKVNIKMIAMKILT